MTLTRLAMALYALWPLAELVLAGVRRAGRHAQGARDRGSLPLLWVGISAGIAAAVLLRGWPPARLPLDANARAAVALGCLVLGLGLRAAAIVQLGRFFTVNVAILDGHRVVREGVYRQVRHPSYAGAMIAFAGMGVLLGSVLSMALILIPVTAVFLRRMQVEERALADALGEEYRAYMRETRRLIPGLY